MDREQQILVTLLSHAIRGEIPPEINMDNVDWSIIYQEAQDHKVFDVLFPIVSKLDESVKPDSNIMGKWFRLAMMSGVNQARNAENMVHVLRLFDELGIEVILLKGLALRNLYPDPSLRYMSDVDILVHPEYVEKAGSLLRSIGYFTTVDTNPKEIRFFNKSHIMIELHWLLIEPGYIDNTDIFEKEIWENKVDALLDDHPVKILSPEDNIIYLLLHMVMHIRNKGFGLKQLCDLVLSIEAHRKTINWMSFEDRIKKFGIEKFTHAILTVCNTLLDLENPIKIYKNQFDDELIDMLISDIFGAGVFGGKSQARSYIRYTIDSIGEEPETFPSRVSLFISCLFPKRTMLAERYEYAKKYPILLPFAWIHRFLYNLFFVEKGQRNLFKLRIPKDIVDVYNERNKLLKHLGL